MEQEKGRTEIHELIKKVRKERMEWTKSEVDRASYLAVKPKIVIDTNDGITEEE